MRPRITPSAWPSIRPKQSPYALGEGGQQRSAHALSLPEPAWRSRPVLSLAFLRTLLLGMRYSLVLMMGFADRKLH